MEKSVHVYVGRCIQFSLHRTLGFKGEIYKAELKYDQAAHGVSLFARFNLTAKESVFIGARVGAQTGN